MLPFDPTTFDKGAVARATLLASAQTLAQYMVPVAEQVANRGVALNNIAVPTGISGATPLQWPTDGFLVGIRAATTDGVAASMAGVSLRIQVNSDTDVWTSGSGSGGAYMPLVLLSGANSTQGRWPYRKLFYQAAGWNIFTQNVTGGALTINVVFDIIDCRDPTL